VHRRGPSDRPSTRAIWLTLRVLAEIVVANLRHASGRSLDEHHPALISEISVQSGHTNGHAAVWVRVSLDLHVVVIGAEVGHRGFEQHLEVDNSAKSDRLKLCANQAWSGRPGTDRLPFGEISVQRAGFGAVFRHTSFCARRRTGQGG